MLVMISLGLVTCLLSLSVSATTSLLLLVPILCPFCHLDTITPYHAISPISILSIIVPLSHFLLPLCYWFVFCSLVTSVT